MQIEKEVSVPTPTVRALLATLLGALAAEAVVRASWKGCACEPGLEWEHECNSP
jgi:hypothetical protein